MKKKKYKDILNNNIFINEKSENKLINERKLLITKINNNNFRIPFHEFYNLKYENKNSDGWFSIKEAPIHTKININNNNSDFPATIIKCKKIIILPNKKQQNILLNWFEAYRKMYNYTLNKITELSLTKTKNRFNFRNLRDNFCKDKKEEYMNRFNINSHILDGAIKLISISYKSAFTNFKRGNIRHFRIRPIKQTKTSKIIDLEKCYFFKDGFCKRILGKMITKDNFNFSSINNDCKLHYNLENKRFTLLVPIIENVKQVNNSNFVSIDPGLKTFLTGFSSNKIYNIGTNLMKTIETNLNKIDRLSAINNKKCRKIISRIKRKNYNMITDLHWKSINYLLNKEKIKYIIIGKWSTKSISSYDKNLRKIYKRIASSLRFYEFLEKLKFKCNESKSNLVLVDESYTSKICSFCKNESVIGTNRRLTCKCGLNLDRDINGCVNILLKAVN
jgi:putative transposase